MNYQQAKQIRKTSAIALLIKNLAREDTTLAGSIKDTAKQKISARGKGMAEKFDMMNILKLMGFGTKVGSLMAAGYGKVRGRSQEDIDYFTGRKRHYNRRYDRDYNEEQTATPFRTKISTTSSAPYRSRDTVSNIATRLYNFMWMERKETEMEQKNNIKERKSDFKLKEKRTKQLIEAFGGTYKMSDKSSMYSKYSKMKRPKKDKGKLLKYGLLAGVGAAAFLFSDEVFAKANTALQGAKSTWDKGLDDLTNEIQGYYDKIPKFSDVMPFNKIKQELNEAMAAMGMTNLLKIDDKTIAEESSAGVPGQISSDAIQSEEDFKKAIETELGKEISAQDLEGIIRIINAEAGPSSMPEMAAIIKTIINRVKKGDKTILEVISAPKQYSAWKTAPSIEKIDPTRKKYILQSGAFLKDVNNDIINYVGKFLVTMNLDEYKAFHLRTEGVAMSQKNEQFVKLMQEKYRSGEGLVVGQSYFYTPPKQGVTLAPILTGKAAEINLYEKFVEQILKDTSTQLDIITPRYGSMTTPIPSEIKEKQIDYKKGTLSFKLLTTSKVVYCLFGGTIQEIDSDKKCVTIMGGSKKYGVGGIRYCNLHIISDKLKEGEKIKRGEIIGELDPTNPKLELQFMTAQTFDDLKTLPEKIKNLEKFLMLGSLDASVIPTLQQNIIPTMIAEDEMSQILAEATPIIASTINFMVNNTTIINQRLSNTNRNSSPALIAGIPYGRSIVG